MAALTNNAIHHASSHSLKTSILQNLHLHVRQSLYRQCSDWAASSNSPVTHVKQFGIGTFQQEKFKNIYNFETPSQPVK